MKLTYQLSLFILLIPTLIFGQFKFETIDKENQKFRDSLNQRFSKESDSPLPLHILDEFQSLPFFKIDTSFYFITNFKKLEHSKNWNDPIAKVDFYIKGILNQLFLYRYNDDDLLFLPFTDLTNGFETYARGRYIIIPYPLDDKIEIDFNKSINSDCAYTYDPPCFFPPKENHINFPIRAGVQFPQDDNWKKLDKQPKYKNGNGSFYSDLFKNINIPDNLNVSNIKLSMVVRAIINEDGSISNAKIETSVDDVLDKLVVKAFNEMGAGSFHPAERNGIKVRKYLTFVIDPRHYK